MRVVKDPDTRKQEILDGAIKIFARKGYEKTTTADISNELGISQGLCYRYYPTKEAIYDAALERYADFIVEANLQKVGENISVHKLIERISGHMGEIIGIEKENATLYQLFHSENSRRMHDELFLKVMNKIIPHVQEHLRRAKESGEIQIKDTDGAAVIGIYGWFGLFMTGSFSNEEISRIMCETWKRLLDLS